RIGITYSPVSGEPVTRDTVTKVVDALQQMDNGTRLMVLCPLLPHEDRTLIQELYILLSKGYTRVMADGEICYIEELVEEEARLDTLKEVLILIDRTAIQHDDEDSQYRLADSIQTAFFEGHGECTVDIPGQGRRTYSDRFERDGIIFEEPSVNFFSFNNPYGACKTCEGFGKVLGIDEDLVIPDKNMSIYEGAVAPWRSEKMSEWVKPLIRNAMSFDFPVHRSYNELTDAQQNLVWTGNKYFKGLNKFFKYVESKTHKIQYRVMLSRYRGRTTCPDCRGTRLRKDAAYVKVGNKSIMDLVLLPVDKVAAFFRELPMTEHEQKVARRILTEITNRLEYLERVGLGYLTLNRVANTLSGGEFQRIKLATSLGSALVGSMYILDEPSIGLHPRDTDRLIGVLKSLRDLGNTVIVVEHEEDVMKAADQIIDIGPDAGRHGGELIFQGAVAAMNGKQKSHTSKYLSGREKIAVPDSRRKWRNSIKVIGATENNLKNIDVEIPLDVMTVVTGVSGSGKSTLVKKIVTPALSKILGLSAEETGKFSKLDGDYNLVTQVEFVDQNPIGKSSRSNPVTYVKAYDAIRNLFADQPLSKQRGYKPSHFSFNVDGGRCEVCKGEGTQKVEMQFMADIYLTCEGCKGKRFKQEILDISYHDKDISEVLDLTVEESLTFFKGNTSVLNRLRPLFEVGLGYVQLGQSSNSLSGGEAQRVKLASFLGKGNSGDKSRILFIFDEPTTGLHFHDIRRLLDALNALIAQGHTVLVIEHNMDVVKTADWIIDLGPEGGDRGGDLVFSGTPEKMVTLTDNHTAHYLKEKL
ncbi:MAG: excinuclease ABC subunit UvrA, partial [Cyclobacteriaceae bacterium]